MAQRQVSKVGIFHNGKYLMGVRQDTGKWTEPGGHLNKNESPLDGAIREVKEETGITLSNPPVFLGSKAVPEKDLIVHAFKADLKKEPDTSVASDPDHEVFGWNWIPVKGKKLPSSVQNNLHVPAKDNVLHFYLGFEKQAFRRFLTPAARTKAFFEDIPSQIAQSYPAEFREEKKKKSK